MFVIVYLRVPKCYTVVPEEFIMDLKEKNVKNYGINRNQARRIYFSKEWFENQTNKVNLDQQFVPNFHLPCTALYPLANDVAETNFEGHMILFEDTFDAAIQKANGYRPQMPAVYNAARENERPIPRIELSAVEINEQNNDEQEGERENAEQNAPENVQEHDQEDLEATFYDSIAFNSDVDVKPVISVEDIAALDDLFEDATQNQHDPLADDHQPENFDSSNTPTAESFDNGIVQESTRIDESSLVQNTVAPDEMSVANVDDEIRRSEERKRQIAENAKKVLLFGKKVVVDTDVEYISLPDQKLEAIKMEPEYQVKTNDLLSGKKAFKTYVSNISCYFNFEQQFDYMYTYMQDNGDRYFMVQNGDEFEEILLPFKAVNGLHKMNELKRSEQFDVAFLKAMVIGFCTMRNVKESGRIDKKFRGVIEGLLNFLSNQLNY